MSNGTEASAVEKALALPPASELLLSTTGGLHSANAAIYGARDAETLAEGHRITDQPAHLNGHSAILLQSQINLGHANGHLRQQHHQHSNHLDSGGPHERATTIVLLNQSNQVGKQQNESISF